MGFFVLLWKFKELIITAVVLAVVGYYIHKGYENVHYHYYELPALLEIEKKHHSDDIALWTQQVKDRQEELDAFKKKNAGIVANNEQKLKTVEGELAATRATNEELLKRIPIDSTVTVPASIVSLWNSIVRGSETATRSGHDAASQADDTGATKTVAAMAFGTFLNQIGEQYNKLAAECVTLTDEATELTHDTGRP